LEKTKQKLGKGVPLAAFSRKEICRSFIRKESEKTINLLRLTRKKQSILI